MLGLDFNSKGSGDTQRFDASSLARKHEEVCLFVSFFLSFSLLVCLIVCLFVCLFDCLFVCLFVCLIVWLFVCLVVCLFVCRPPAFRSFLAMPAVLMLLVGPISEIFGLFCVACVYNSPPSSVGRAQGP